MSGHKKNNLHDKRVAVRDADVVTLFFMLETANLSLPSNLSCQMLARITLDGESYATEPVEQI